MAHLLLVVLVLVCSLAMPQLASVEKGPYWSLGHIKGFLGSVAAPAQLRAALEACSFKREIIIISLSASSYDPAFQTMDALRKWGIAHVMMVADREDTCRDAQLLNPFESEALCCVWAVPEVPKNELAHHAFSAHRFLMHVRMRVAARTLRLRYNILFMDTDLCFFDNPYTFLKAPPLSSFNLLHASDNELFANIGVMYAQNAAPNGPTAWVFAEMPDRQLRWGEHPDFFKTKTDFTVTNSHHTMWDQPNFSDASLSTATGFPIFPMAWTFQAKGMNMSWQHMHGEYLNRVGHRDTVEISGRMSMVASQRSNSLLPLRWFDMRQVTNNGSWPIMWGGVGYPAQRLNYSSAWIQLLKEQAPEEPMWPDHEKPFPPCSDAEVGQIKAASKAGRPLAPWCTALGLKYRERMAAFPAFFVHAWWTRNLRRHNWDIRIEPPTQVIGHNLYMPGDKRVYKNALKMTYGHYNWTLAALVKKPLPAPKGAPKPEPHSRVGLFLASTLGRLMPTVVRVSPSIPLADMSFLQTTVVLHHLIAAAIVLERVFAWPAWPCTALNRMLNEQKDISWLSEERPHGAYYMTGVVPFPVSRQPLHAYRLLAAPNVSSSSSSNSQRVKGRSTREAVTSQVCMWYDYMYDSCLAEGLGMLPVESEHYDQLFPAPNNLTGGRASAAWQPHGPENTLTLTPAQPDQKAPITIQLPPHWQPLPEPTGAHALPHQHFQKLFVPVTLAQLKAAHTRPEAVMYLDRVPFIIDLHKKDDGGYRKRVEHVRRACNAVPKVGPLLAYLTGTL